MHNGGHMFLTCITLVILTVKYSIHLEECIELLGTVKKKKKTSKTDHLGNQVKLEHCQLVL